MKSNRGCSKPLSHTDIKTFSQGLNHFGNTSLQRFSPKIISSSCPEVNVSNTPVAVGFNWIPMVIHLASSHKIAAHNNTSFPA